MDNYTISVGQSRYSKFWRSTELSWPELMERLNVTTRTAESVGEYNNMTKSQRDSVKDVGGFVGGKLKSGRRNAGFVDNRTLLTLDADFASVDFPDSISLLFGSTYAIYSTHSHTPEKPRYRLIIPLSRPCSPDEYEAAARSVAYEIGIDYFDDTTYQPHRLMYWPSTCIDGEYVFTHEERQPLDIDAVLAKYDDWTDAASWPVSSRTVRKLNRLIKNQEDPTQKNGVVGAFCRAHDIYDLLENEFSDLYSPCSTKDRYTYIAGSTSGGLVVYEDGRFAYSNHATDPIGGVLVNAFDMYRLIRFGDEDEDSAPGTPTVKQPSYTHMMDYAKADKKTKGLILAERRAAATEDFAEAIAENEEEAADWMLELEMDKHGRCLPSIDNAKIILEHDAGLKGRVALNAFTQRPKVRGALPWCADTSERDWSDTDDAGLRHYIEKAYALKGKGQIEDAWKLVTSENKYHPVREYLSGLVWDGINRVDTLFIDMIGAEDSEYTRSVTRKALCAAVGRVFVPGIKYDQIPVLVGPQGCGKSQIIKRLGLDWFSDTLTTIQGREAYEQIQGFWIIEMAELAAMKKAEVEAIKHFTAKSEDSYRAAYARHVDTYKRQCVFFATTNRTEFLQDMTGNRRFWPIDLNPEMATKDLWTELDEHYIDMLWAEALELFNRGEKLYIEKESLKRVAEEVQDKHLEESPIAGEIKKFLDLPLPKNWSELDIGERRSFLRGDDFGNKQAGTVRRQRVCAMEIWCEALGGEKKDLDIRRSKEIKDCILKTGEWEAQVKSTRFGEIYGIQRGFYRIL